MGARSRRPSASLAWRDRQTYLGQDLAPLSPPPMCHTDPSDGQRHRRTASGARRAYSTSDFVIQILSACEPPQRERGTKEMTQHQRLSLGRLEVDWLHPDRQLASPQAAMNNQAQKEFNLSNTESPARGITLGENCFRSHGLDKRSVDHSLARTEHKRPEPIKET